MPKVRFSALGRTWEAVVPPGTTLLVASKQVGAPEGDACGGVCACSTCHVYVNRGRDLLSGAEEDEEDILDKAFDVRAGSRLGCQAKVEREGEIVEAPDPRDAKLREEHRGRAYPTSRRRCEGAVRPESRNAAVTAPAPKTPMISPALVSG